MAELGGVLNAATARVVGLVSQVLATEAWPGRGIRSAQARGLTTPARTLAAMAPRLGELPDTPPPRGRGSWPRTGWRWSCAEPRRPSTPRWPPWPATPR
jgi:hypothetical protein